MESHVCVISRSFLLLASAKTTYGYFAFVVPELYSTAPVSEGPQNFEDYPYGHVKNLNWTVASFKSVRV